MPTEVLVEQARRLDVEIGRGRSEGPWEHRQQRAERRGSAGAAAGGGRGGAGRLPLRHGVSGAAALWRSVRPAPSLVRMLRWFVTGAAGRRGMA